MAEDGRGVAMVIGGGGGYRRKRGSCLTSVAGKEKAEARQSAPTMGRGGAS